MMQSILNADNIQNILKIAKENVERNGALQPVVFLHLTSGEHLVTPFDTSGTSQDKIIAMARIGFSLAKQGKAVAEAIMLAEGWFVSQMDGKLDLTTPPSEQPQRREAIVLVGRNASRSRVSSVLQPFTRNGNGIVWQEMELVAFNEPPAAKLELAGLLDFLFVDEQMRQPA